MPENWRKIFGASVIWDNVKIGNECLIKNAVICDNVEIGNKVTILENTIVPTNCKIKDTQSGFRAYSKGTFDKFRFQQNGLRWDRKVHCSTIRS